MFLDMINLEENGWIQIQIFQSIKTFKLFEKFANKMFYIIGDARFSTYLDISSKTIDIVKMVKFI